MPSSLWLVATPGHSLAWARGVNDDREEQNEDSGSLDADKVDDADHKLSLATPESPPDQQQWAAGT